MLKKIERLEKLARKLEPSAAERKQVQQQVIGYTENFIEQLEDGKTYIADHPENAKAFLAPFSENGKDIKKAVRFIKENVNRYGINPASGGHLGFIPGGGVYYAALGDYLAAVTNRYAGIFFSAPGAVRLENQLIRWVAGVMGYPESTGGNLTSGGSISNLIAICTARDAKGVNAETIRRSVIYLTEQAHHSLQKALRIAGLRECTMRYVEMDAQYRMQPAQLQKMIRADRKQGLNPFLIIASAGTTDTGAIDPLAEIGAIARKEKCWFHVDAAYGGFFMLTPEGKKKLAGIELSDSLAADAHKGLFLPFGLGIALVKNKRQLYETHHYDASYMQDARAAIDELSPADASPELTRHFRGLRLWLPLQLHGVKPFRACLQEKLALVQYFHKKIKALGFDSPLQPDLSVVVYRYVPQNGDANTFNKKLLEIVRADGRIFISSTELNGSFMLRLACLSFRTHKKQVDILLQLLEKGVNRLRKLH